MATDPRSCPHCGTTLPVEAHFCLNCGRPTPTEPGVPPRTMPTGAVEVSRVRKALADRYQVERVLGEGGMATVYLAEDLKHHRKVAVKVMRPELAETLGAERFLREVEIAASMSHPHILPVYDSGSADGILYYVMPLVEGESLPARMHRERQLPVDEALRLTREVADALAYAHKRGIIHRDIKPANILITDGHALVADFGIARATSDSAALTKTGLAIGTPQYMSPEQASGEPNLDGRTDIYALGCVLYEMLAGEPPFTGPTAQAIISRSITEAPRPLTRTRAAIPDAVDGAVLKALAKSPADRYATATDMAQALDQAARQGGATTAVAAAPSRPAWPMLAAAALAIILLGAGAFRIFGGRGGSTVSSVAVLPFVNQGNDDDAYFADGIVEELRDRLTRLDKFTVIASSSADQYRGTTKAVTDIANELRVDHVLQGRLRWITGSDGNRQFRVTTELVDGKSGQVTWRDTFDGDVSDPFVVQGRIATRVATALGAALGQDDTRQLEGRPTDNLEAYDLYLQGKAIQTTGAVASRLQANLMERAVALDSNFAAAWALMAAALADVHASGRRDPETAQRTKEAYQQSLRLAPDSAITHIAGFFYHSTVAREQDAARRDIERALQLDPRSPMVLRMASTYDLQDGNYEAMLDKLTRARELDPRNPSTLGSMVQAQLYTGRVEASLEVARELETMAPTSLTQVQLITMAYLANDDLAGARRALAEMSRNLPTTELVAYFAGYHELGFLLSDDQLQLLYRLTPTAFDNDRAWWGQALSTAAWQRGDRERARAWADSSLEEAQQQIEVSGDAQLRILNAASLAYAGRPADARREAERAMADTAGMRPDDISYVMQQYVRTMIALGEREAAIDQLNDLMQRPGYVTVGMLRNDPTFRALDGNPRFERLVNRGIGAPVD